jgi:hypothetical protein
VYVWLSVGDLRDRITVRPIHIPRLGPAIVNTFYALTSALEVDVWFNYVESAANIADWPSRGQVEFANEVNAIRIEGESLKFPKLGKWGSVELALEWAGMPATSALHHGPPAKK